MSTSVDSKSRHDQNGASDKCGIFCSFAQLRNLSNWLREWAYHLKIRHPFRSKPSSSPLFSEKQQQQNTLTNTTQIKHAKKNKKQNLLSSGEAVSSPNKVRAGLLSLSTPTPTIINPPFVVEAPHQESSTKDRSLMYLRRKHSHAICISPLSRCCWQTPSREIERDAYPPKARNTVFFFSLTWQQGRSERAWGSAEQASGSAAAGAAGSSGSGNHQHHTAARRRSRPRQWQQ